MITKVEKMIKEDMAEYILEETMIKITQGRFEQLLDLETRVDVLVDVMRAEKYIALKDIFRILGYSTDVHRIEEEEREEQE